MTAAALTAPETLIPLLAVTLVAAWVHGALGIGFSLVATPLVALWLDMKSVVLLVLAPNILVSAVSMVHGGGWWPVLKRYWLLAVFVVLGSVAGTHLLATHNSDVFKLLLAVLILAYLNMARLQRLNLSWVRDARWLSGPVLATLSGFFGGTVNVVAPPMLIYLLETGTASQVTVQVLNLCFLVGKGAQAATFAWLDEVTPALMVLAAGLVALAYVGVKLGVRVRDRYSDETHRNWMRRLLFATAVILVIRVLWP